ncbi:MAG: hypothetical protein IPJ42_21750 [Betaproteobacteria bacterium]|nr:hypothetical protein [Betaproteobacteria bacterium]
MHQFTDLVRRQPAIFVPGLHRGPQAAALHFSPWITGKARSPATKARRRNQLPPLMGFSQMSCPKSTLGAVVPDPLVGLVRDRAAGAADGAQA